MNRKGWRPALACATIWCLALLFDPAPAVAAEASLDTLIQVSGDSPFRDCIADTGGGMGSAYVGSEVEPWVVVNPTNPLNIVGTWQQDRYSNGGARGLAVGVSFNGGLTWEMVVIPGLTLCSGGSYLRASDPWLSFGPEGDLYHIALAFDPGTVSAMLVNKSIDGGLTWFPPVTLINQGAPFFHDKESITADPTDPNLVYAVWDRISYAANRGPTVFTRSIDGGETWLSVRVIHDPGYGNQTIGNQIVVLPDGTVMNFFTEITRGVLFDLAFKKSVNKGVSWQPRYGSTRAFRMFPGSAVNPDGGFGIRDGSILFDVAVDRHSGALYVVWQDRRFAALTSVGLSTSTDAGLTWSRPIFVNLTPSGVGPANRQAFLPSVHVADTGMIGVSYYDFRFNDPSPGALTDHWFVWCHPQITDCNQRSRWRKEIRLTDVPFDINRAPMAGGLFVGDYVGLASAERDFVALFTQPHDDDWCSAFARRVFMDDDIDPRGPGYWAHQMRSILRDRGRSHEEEKALLRSLEDIHALYDTFDGVSGLDGMLAVLAPSGPHDLRDSLARQLMALLLNLTSERIPPYLEVRDDETVADAIASLAAALDDPASPVEILETAKTTAAALNDGRIPLP